MNNLSVNCFENDQDEGKAWKWISQGLSEGDYVDETLLKFLSNQTDDLEIPNDDYFDGLVDKLKGLDIGILLQNICEQLVTKQIPKDVQTSFWTKLTLKFLEKQCKQENGGNPVDRILAQGRLNYHLSVMAQVYAANKKFMMGEGLFRQSIESLSSSPILPMQPIGLIQAKTKYAKMLMKVPKRENEASRVLEEADQMKIDLKIDS